MAVYLIVFLAVSLCALTSCIQISSKSKIFFYWGSATILILLSAIRDYSVGADTINYCQRYRYFRQISFMEAMNFKWERGYVAVNWLVGHIFKNERMLLVFMAIFILVPIFCWIKKESKWPLLSLVIFVGMGMWSTSMFILRQWSAMAILTYSYKYIKEKKFIPFMGIVVIAMMFHRTAAIFLLAYIIINMPLKKTTIIFSVPFSITIGLLGKKILVILNHFARISESGNFNGGVSLLIVLWLCIIAVLICFKGDIPSSLIFSYKIVFLAAFLQPIAFTFSNWSRIVVYFSISLTIFLPNFIMKLTRDSTRNKKMQLPLGALVCLLMFIWFQKVDVSPYIFMN